ncbi:MAG: EF-hand domain-containing protein [Chloroflexota bacterium]
MLSEFQRQKLRQLFRLYDVNQDGAIHQLDFEIAAARLSIDYGLELDSTEAEQIRTIYTDYWGYLQRYMDSDRDKAISEQEFVESHEFFMRQEESLEALILSMSEYIIQLTDRNGDGMINRAEYVHYLIAHNISSKDAESAFDVLDHNNSNTLTHDEILNSVRVFLTSGVSTMPGNRLFGDKGEEAKK